MMAGAGGATRATGWRATALRFQQLRRGGSYGIARSAKGEGRGQRRACEIDLRGARPAPAACAALGFAKFQRLASAHSYLAKFFGLALFLGLTAILGLGISTGVLPALAIIGLVMNAEILAILILARKPPVDVLSVFHLGRA